VEEIGMKRELRFGMRAQVSSGLDHGKESK